MADESNLSTANTTTDMTDVGRWCIKSATNQSSGVCVLTLLVSAGGFAHIALDTLLLLLPN